MDQWTINESPTFQPGDHFWSWLYDQDGDEKITGVVVDVLPDSEYEIRWDHNGCQTRWPGRWMVLNA